MNKPQNKTSQGKVSWVEFLRSIRFDQNKAQSKKAKSSGECSSHFASFDQRIPAAGGSADDHFLVRSAN